ncbi:MAG: hypothetical protein AAF797_00825 [Planctomycetota bacterium]
MNAIAVAITDSSIAAAIVEPQQPARPLAISPLGSKSQPLLLLDDPGITHVFDRAQQIAQDTTHQHQFEPYVPDPGRADHWSAVIAGIVEQVLACMRMVKMRLFIATSFADDPLPLGAIAAVQPNITGVIELGDSIRSWMSLTGNRDLVILSRQGFTIGGTRLQLGESRAASETHQAQIELEPLAQAIVSHSLIDSPASPADILRNPRWILTQFAKALDPASPVTVSLNGSIVGLDRSRFATSQSLKPVIEPLLSMLRALEPSESTVVILDEPEPLLAEALRNAKLPLLVFDQPVAEAAALGALSIADTARKTFPKVPRGRCPVTIGLSTADHETGQVTSETIIAQQTPLPARGKLLIDTSGLEHIELRFNFSPPLETGPTLSHTVKLTQHESLGRLNVAINIDTFGQVNLAVTAEVTGRMACTGLLTPLWNACQIAALQAATEMRHKTFCAF